MDLNITACRDLQFVVANDILHVFYAKTMLVRANMWSFKGKERSLFVLKV